MKTNKFGKTEKTAGRNVRREQEETKRELAESESQLNKASGGRFDAKSEIEDDRVRSLFALHASDVLSDIGKIGSCTEDLLRHAGEVLFSLSMLTEMPSHLKPEDVLNLDSGKDLKGLGPISEVRPALDDCFPLFETDLCFARLNTCARFIESTGTAPKEFTASEVKMARWWLLLAKHLEPLLIAAKGFQRAATAEIANALL